MPRIGLFYGSNEGHTEEVARRIRVAFDAIEPDAVKVYNIGQSQASDILGYEYLIFGIPTWNIGELQDDWAIFFPTMDSMDFNGKKVALFGLGDQFGYSATFVDAIGIVGKKAREKGAAILGTWPRFEYQFEDSVGLENAEWLIGLAVDEDNEKEFTEERIQSWVKMVAVEFGMAPVPA